ncbi:hypothetical protein [Aliagarivorans marinus]|uniref:hypothetical protein n=1 Tax=Aliagarivorans marinus TaxID=561965 RepID=UPI00040BC1F3|nr:hypothetical protein [Aliagarivorans marinus]
MGKILRLVLLASMAAFYLFSNASLANERITLATFLVGHAQALDETTLEQVRHHRHHKPYHHKRPFNGYGYTCKYYETSSVPPQVVNIHYGQAANAQSVEGAMFDACLMAERNCQANKSSWSNSCRKCGSYGVGHC